MSKATQGRPPVETSFQHRPIDHIASPRVDVWRPTLLDCEICSTVSVERHEDPVEATRSLRDSLLAHSLEYGPAISFSNDTGGGRSSRFEASLSNAAKLSMPAMTLGQANEDRPIRGDVSLPRHSNLVDWGT